MLNEIIEREAEKFVEEFDENEKMLVSGAFKEGMIKAFSILAEMSLHGSVQVDFINKTN